MTLARHATEPVEVLDRHWQCVRSPAERPGTSWLPLWQSLSRPWQLRRSLSPRRVWQAGVPSSADAGEGAALAFLALTVAAAGGVVVPAGLELRRQTANRS